MAKKYTHDLIVIGAGSGGLTAAIFMQRAGFDVLLIDRAPQTFGGDCLNYGCIPSKSLLHVANMVHTSNQAAEFRDQQTGAVDIPKVMDYVRSRQEHIRLHENPEYLKTEGIDIAVGAAHFSGKRQVTVSDKIYSAKRIIIATGSRPRELQLEGLQTVSHYTNETIFKLQTLPKNFVFIGGGPINIELGQAFARLGSKVTILQSGQRILPNESAEVSAHMQSLLEQEGLQIYCNVKTQKIEAGQILVITADGTTQNHAVDAVFVGIGRVPNVDALELEQAEIACDNNRRVILDDYLRTTNTAVCVVGDAAGQHMFTHAAELQAMVVLNNLFAPIKKRYIAKNMAWTTFSNPEIASFGSNEDQLKLSNTRFETITVSLDEDDRAITENTTDGFIKLHLDRKGCILGGVMIGHDAGNIVSQLLYMMHQNLPLKTVLSQTFPYPIGARIIQTAARQQSLRRFDKQIIKQVLKILYH